MVAAAVCATALPPARATADGILDALIGAARNAPPVLYEGKEKVYGPATMTPAQLKNCIVMAYQMDETSAAINGQKQVIFELDERIRDAGPRIRMLAETARIDPRQRNTYAVRVEAYNAWVDSRHNAVRDHNQRVRHLGELSRQFDQQCNGRSYFPSDLADVSAALPPNIKARIK